MSRLLSALLLVHYCMCMDMPDQAHVLIRAHYIKASTNTSEKKELSNVERTLWHTVDEECYKELIVNQRGNPDGLEEVIRIYGKVFQKKKEYEIPYLHDPAAVYKRLLQMCLDKDRPGVSSISDFFSYIKKLPDNDVKKLEFLDDVSKSTIEQTTLMIRNNLEVMQSQDDNIDNLSYVAKKLRSLLEFVESIKAEKIKILPDRKETVTPERVEAWRDQRKLEGEISPRLEEKERRKEEIRKQARPSQLLRIASTTLFSLETKLRKEEPARIELEKLQKIKEQLEACGDEDDLDALIKLQTNFSPPSIKNEQAQNS